MEYERSASGARVGMVTGLISLDADAVAVAEVVARASALRCVCVLTGLRE